MTTWAIGDIHGCLDEFRELLTRIGYRRGVDRLWLVGDLVNRGPQSLETLRYVSELGEDAICVLGNHDLHLLATAHGIRGVRSRDTFTAILTARDRETLLDWLRQRPLLHHDPDLGFTLVHAGLHPHWDLATAQALAREIEARLAGGACHELLTHMYGNEPDAWSPAHDLDARHRFAINAMTRMRYCYRDGRLALDCSGPPGSQPRHLLPWFDVPGRCNRDLRILFGHWSTLGYCERNGVHALDAGCLWGGRLTALELLPGGEAGRRVQLDCPGAMRPDQD